jgi:organic radical activating enzyme
LPSTLLRLLARRYLGKPDLAEFLALRFPDRAAVLAGLRNELAFRLRRHRLPRLTTLNVELTSRCNVACSYCRVTAGLVRRARDLPLERLEQLLRETPGLQTLLPFQWGEPLLYEALDEALGMARRFGLRSYLTTNGTLLDADRFRRLAHAGLERLTVSLDGSAASHAARRGYAQAPILARLAEARAVQQREGLATRLDVSMVVDADIEAEIEPTRRRLEPLCDRVQFIPRLTRARRQSACREPSRGVMVVLSDGRITTCCVDADGSLELGHVDDGPLQEQYGGPRFVALRQRHAARDLPAICAACGECDTATVSARFG